MLKNLVNISILTTVVVAVWLFVSIFHSSTSTTISPELVNQTLPIPPNFNLQAIAQLKKRNLIPTDLSEVIQVGSGSAAPAVIPTATPTIVPTATPSIPVSAGTIQESTSSGFLAL